MRVVFPHVVAFKANKKQQRPKSVGRLQGAQGSNGREGSDEEGESIQRRL